MLFAHIHIYFCFDVAKCWCVYTCVQISSSMVNFEHLFRVTTITHTHNNSTLNLINAQTWDQYSAPNVRVFLSSNLTMFRWKMEKIIRSSICLKDAYWIILLLNQIDQVQFTYSTEFTFSAQFQNVCKLFCLRKIRACFFLIKHI